MGCCRGGIGVVLHVLRVCNDFGLPPTSVKVMIVIGQRDSTADCLLMVLSENPPLLPRLNTLTAKMKIEAKASRCTELAAGMIFGIQEKLHKGAKDSEST